jgi:hypothetical protein
VGSLGISGWVALLALAAHVCVPFSNSLIIQEDALLLTLLSSVIVARAVQALVNGDVSKAPVVVWAVLALVAVRLSLLFATCREEAGERCAREIAFLTDSGGQQALNAAAAVLLFLHERQHTWFRTYHNLEGGARHRMRWYVQAPIVLSILFEWTLEYLQGEHLAVSTPFDGSDGTGSTSNSSGPRTRLQQLEQLVLLDVAQPLVRTLFARIALILLLLGVMSFYSSPVCARVERRLRQGSEPVILAHGVPTLFTAGLVLMTSTMYSLAMLLVSPMQALGLSLAVVLAALLLQFQAVCHGMVWGRWHCDACLSCPCTS